MIPLCSRFDSVLFNPNMSAIASYGNFSRSPKDIYRRLPKSVRGLSSSGERFNHLVSGPVHHDLTALDYYQADRKPHEARAEGGEDDRGFAFKACDLGDQRRLPGGIKIDRRTIE